MEKKMKKFVKPLILMIMVAVLATLIVIPSNLNAKDPTVFPGTITTFAGLPACACPCVDMYCACIMLPPVN
jgi:hypothetical protein